MKDYDKKLLNSLEDDMIGIFKEFKIGKSKEYLLKKFYYPVLNEVKSKSQFKFQTLSQLTGFKDAKELIEFNKDILKKAVQFFRRK